MGAKLTKEKKEYHESPKTDRNSIAVGKGVSVVGGHMNDVVGVKQTIINHYNPRSKDHKKTLRPPKRSNWNMLMKRHRKDESWIYPFPWDTTIRLAPEDFFIQLTMAVMDRTGQVDLGYVIELEQLFDPILEGTDRPEHILIRGDAGYGKSTLCTKIAYDWARNITTFTSFPPEDSLVLLYRLRDLPPDSDLEEELRSYAHKYYTSDDSSISNTQMVCWSYGHKLLLILDGYDEICSEHQNQVRDLLSCQDQHPHSFFKMASILVTSRPDTDQDLLFMFDKHCRLTGLSEERRLKLVNSFIRRNTGCATSVLTFLNNYEDPCTKNLSPLLILMICYISKQGGFDIVVDAGQLSLYCIQLMAKRCNERGGLNLTQDDINQKLHELGKFFYKCLSNNTLFLRASDMKAFLKEHYDFAVQFGILRNSFVSDDEQKKEIFEPIHKHFMEALAKNYLLEVWSSLHSEDRLNFVNDFVDSLSTEIFLVLGKESEYQIKITAKDRMHKGNRIIYTWGFNPLTEDVNLELDQISPTVVDLSMKVTTNNPLEGDIDFLIKYITNAFSDVSHLKQFTSFLTLFRQHIYRVKFCRLIDQMGRPCEYKANYVFYGLDKSYVEPEEPTSAIPWSELTDKVSLFEIELGEALLKTSTLVFVCERLLGFKVETLPSEETAKETFLKLFRALQKCHDRFYIKCVLKNPVGSRMYRMINKRQNKVHLITFQCNYKHKHTHPREVEVDENDRIVPSFDWNNIHSVIFYFSK